MLCWKQVFGRVHYTVRAKYTRGCEYPSMRAPIGDHDETKTSILPNRIKQYTSGAFGVGPDSLP